MAKQNNKESRGLVTKESICATLGLFAVAALFILCTRSLVFGEFGAAVFGFLTGMFGYCAYPLFLSIVYLCVTGLLGKRLVKDRLFGFFIVCEALLVALIIHTATTYSWKLDGYLTACFEGGEALATVTAAGWFGGLVVFALSKLFTQLGAIIVFSALALVGLYVCVKVAKRPKKQSDEFQTERKDKRNKHSAVKSVEIPLTTLAKTEQKPQAVPQTERNFTRPSVPQMEGYPYAPHPQNGFAQPQQSVAQPQGGQAFAQNGYNGGFGYAQPTVTQTPGVRLNDEPAFTQAAPQPQPEQPAAPTSFSPFGDFTKMTAEDTPRPVFERKEGYDERKTQTSYTGTPREILFGGSPAENYKRNLLFDPCARVNNMPVAEESNPLGGTSGFMPSYADAYQNAVNESGTDRTAFTQNNDFSGNTAQSFGNSAQNYNADASFDNGAAFGNTQNFTEYPSRGENTGFSAPRFESRSADPARRDDSPYALFGEPSFRGEDRETPAFERGESFDRNESDRTETFGRGEFDRSESLETSDRDSALLERSDRDEGEYRRHDYMDLFSLNNPNVFGRDSELSRRENADLPMATSRDAFDDMSARRDSERLDVSDNDRRDGLHLLDDEDDRYALRSDEDEQPRVGNVGFRFEDESELDRGRSAEPSGREVFDDRAEGLDRGGEISAPTDFGRGEERGVVEERSSFTPSFPEPKTEQKPVPVQHVQPPQPVQPPKPRVIKPYVRVRLDDMDCRDISPSSNFEEVEETKSTILSTLEDFKVTGASIASVTFGPTVARYNVSIPRHISPKKVVALDQSIAIGLRSNGVNVYPNYEDGVVSIEVPNKERQFVQLGCMLSGDTFVNAKSSSLMFAMGKDVANRKIYGDVSKMIHLLVAGSSGSGKSVFLGALITSMIYKYSPEELRLILIDPKKTEFVLYNGLPHLMINEIITDANKAVQSLNWAIMEMNRRYGLFEQMSRSGAYVVNLDGYNAQVEKSKRLPKIVIIIDELADLMLAAKKEMEDRIQNLTQKARAAGIHLIVATQRPSTDVITGVIKSNLPTRIAFYVATDVDSRVILDQTGAQKLLGKGDLLYTMPGIAAPIRVQSAFISPEESQRVIQFIKDNNEAYYDEEATAFINSRGGNGGETGGGGSASGDGVDPIYIEALRHVIACGSASISMIQRKCGAGYSRAGKIVEWMEDMGYISAFDGAKARKVLITKEEFEIKYGPLE